MNKAALAITLGLGTCVTGGLFGTALVGRSVVTRLSQETRRVAQDFPIEVVEETVEHGMFHSSRTVKLRLGCLPKNLPNLPGIDPSQPLEFSLRDDVYHGPIPAGAGFALAAIDSQLVLPEGAEAAWKQAGGKGAPLSARSIFRFDGSFESELKFPGLRHNEPETQLEIQPILAKLRGSFGNRAVNETSLESTGIVLQAKNGKLDFALTLEGLRADVQTEAAPEGIKFLKPGKSVWKIQSVRLRGAPTDLKSVKPIDARFEGVLFTSQSKLQDGAYSVQASSETQAKINQLDAGKLSSRSTLRNVDAGFYEAEAARFVDAFFKCSADDKPVDVGAYTTSLLDALPKMLLRNPEYALEYLRLERAGKSAEVSYRVATQGVTQADLDAKPQLVGLLLDKGEVALKAQLSMALVEQLASDVAVAATGSGDEAASAIAMLKILLQPAIQAGYVVQDGDLLKAHAELKAGKLAINGGEPISLGDPGVLGLFGP